MVPSLLHQVSYSTESVGVKLLLDSTIHYQPFLGFGGAFTIASSELEHSDCKSGTASGPYHPIPTSN